MLCNVLHLCIRDVVWWGAEGGMREGRGFVRGVRVGDVAGWVRVG